MKRIALLLVVICILLCLCSCSEEKYKLEISNDLSVMNEVKSEYPAGEKVTIKLETLTEHYYIVTVNGVEIEMTDRKSVV